MCAFWILIKREYYILVQRGDDVYSLGEARGNMNIGEEQILGLGLHMSTCVQDPSTDSTTRL